MSFLWEQLRKLNLVGYKAVWSDRTLLTCCFHIHSSTLETKAVFLSCIFVQKFQPHFSWFAAEMLCKWLFNRMLISHALTTLCVTHIANWQPYSCSTDILVWVALHNQAYFFLCSNQKLKRRLVFLRDDVPDDLTKHFLGVQLNCRYWASSYSWHGVCICTQKLVSEIQHLLT